MLDGLWGTGSSQAGVTAQWLLICAPISIVVIWPVLLFHVCLRS